MSSYQFVNSLTSCYGQRVASAPDAASTANPADYYSQQAYNSCYGPTAAPASPAYAGYLGQNGTSDHHNPHTHHLNAYPSATGAAAAAAAAAVACGQQPHSRHHQSPVLPTRTPTPSSCKYAPVDSAASPQDLSTSSTGAGQSSESGSRGSPTAPQSSARNSSGAAASGQAGGQTVAGENNSNNKNPASGQAHIYPWMRKVHVGQSKFAKSECHFLLLPVMHLSILCILSSPHPLFPSLLMHDLHLLANTDAACQAE